MKRYKSKFEEANNSCSACYNYDDMNKACGISEEVLSQYPQNLFNKWINNPNMKNKCSYFESA